MTRFGVIVAAAVLAASQSAGAQRGPAPAMTLLPPDVLAQACAPTLTYTRPAPPWRVTGGQDARLRVIYGPGDLVTINAGTRDGIAPGQQFFTRRVQAHRNRPISTKTPGTVRTSGWITVYAVDDDLSLAMVTHVCDPIRTGDYLEPFATPVPPVVDDADLQPQRSDYGRILFANDGRETFSTGDFFLIDRGSDQGVTAGARFVVYRDRRIPNTFLFELGEAVAVDVRPGSSTLRAIRSADAFARGDYVAQRRPVVNSP